MTLSLPKATLCSRLRLRYDDLEYKVLELFNENIETNEEVEAVCKIVRKLPSLKFIHLSGNRINDDHLVPLFESLPLTLEGIDLSYNNFTSKGLHYVLLQTHRFKRLTELHIYNAKNLRIYDWSILDFHPMLCDFQGTFGVPLQTFLRTKINFFLQRDTIKNYRLKLRKFIWLIAKKKIDEFLLIELFHKLN